MGFNYILFSYSFLKIEQILININISNNNKAKTDLLLQTKFKKFFKKVLEILKL